MARLRGRALQGERCRAAAPHRHWKTTTFTEALPLDGITAPIVLDSPMYRVTFQACIEQVLVPTLRRGTPLSWTTCPPTKVRRYAEPSRQPERPAALLARLQPVGFRSACSRECPISMQAPWVRVSRKLFGSPNRWVGALGLENCKMPARSCLGRPAPLWTSRSMDYGLIRNHGTDAPGRGMQIHTRADPFIQYTSKY